VINLERIRHHRLETQPFGWAAIKDLYQPHDAQRLAATYPCDHFKLVASYGGEKDYEYEARSLIGMGATDIMHPADLSDAWRALALDLLSAEYRAAMATLTGRDLADAPIEVNVIHYGPGGSLGAHRDLPEKLVTHVLYFNRSWSSADGGCLSVLGSADPADLVAEVPPLVGHSAVIVRSDNSWHAVSRVVSDSRQSRRSVTVTFYRPGSVSTMWPPGDMTPLHRYFAADLT
jgi:SM-20-related protein